MKYKIYRKRTSTDTTINRNSNHPQEHKVPLFRAFFNRIDSTLTETKEKKEETKVIEEIAYNNGYAKKEYKKR